MPKQVCSSFFKKEQKQQQQQKTRQVNSKFHTHESICHFIISGQMVINIEDVNDNAPEFIYSDSVFGEFISE